MSAGDFLKLVKEVQSLRAEMAGLRRLIEGEFTPPPTPASAASATDQAPKANVYPPKGWRPRSKAAGVEV